MEKNQKKNNATAIKKIENFHQFIAWFHISILPNGVAIVKATKQTATELHIKIWSENHWPSYQTLIHCLPLYLHLLHSTRIPSMRACAQALDICMIFVCALAAIDYNFTLYYIRLVWSEKKVFICKWLNHHHPHFSLLHYSYYYSMENWERRNKQHKNGNRLLYICVHTLCTLCGGSSQIIWELFFSLDFGLFCVRAHL